MLLDVLDFLGGCIEILDIVESVKRRPMTWLWGTLLFGVIVTILILVGA